MTKTGNQVPIFPKMIVISPRLTPKTVKSIVGSKELSPLAWFGANPNGVRGKAPAGGRRVLAQPIAS